MQIFGLWHAGNHYADWAITRDMEEFDDANRWIIDRGDGRPSVNLVVLSFVHPMRLLNQTVAPKGAGETAGMLGYMFWAAEIPSARKNYVPTTPPNSCEDGMGVAATVFDLPIPMEELRKD